MANIDLKKQQMCSLPATDKTRGGKYEEVWWKERMGVEDGWPGTQPSYNTIVGSIFHSLVLVLLLVGRRKLMGFLSERNGEREGLGIRRKLKEYIYIYIGKARRQGVGGIGRGKSPK